MLDLLPFTQIEPLGIVGEGVEYRFPPFRALQQAVKENHTLFEKKAEQGFTELDISLTAMTISELQTRLSELLRRHHTQTPYSDSHPDGIPQLLGTKGPRDHTQLIPLNLNDQQLISIWDEIIQGETSGALLYYPTSFRIPYGGYTKTQLVKQTENTPSPGYEFFFTSPYTFLPRHAEAQTRGGRKQLENDDTSFNYLQTLQEDTIYAHESGLTINHLLTTFSVRLFLTNEVIYDLHDANGAWFIGNIVFGGVPGGRWNRRGWRLYVGGRDPGSRSERWGWPSAVRVFSFK